jgi:hypothetical protein
MTEKVCVTLQIRLLSGAGKVSPKTHNLILANDKILFVQRRETHRDSDKYPIPCRFQNTCSRGYTLGASV